MILFIVHLDTTRYMQNYIQHL